MSLANDPISWSRLPHGDQTAWEDFLGGNQLQHATFDVAIRRAGGAAYPILPLGTSARSTWLMGEEEEPSPFLWYPDTDWMASHQAVHDGEAASLLIAAPPDLQSYDLTNPDDFATWAWLHALEHKRLRQAIGI